MCVFENMTYPLVGLRLVDVVDEHDLEFSDISETIPNRYILKNWMQNMRMCVFKNMTYPLVGLGLVDLEASDISENIPNRILLKYWI